MKTDLLKYTGLSIFCFFIRISLIAQPEISVYTDQGQNNVSDGFFIKSAALTNYQFGKYNAEAGIQFDIKSRNNGFSGYSFKFSRDFRVKGFPFEFRIFNVGIPYSDVIRESNLGFLVNIERNHFAINTGLDFRTYALKIKEFEIHNTKIHEAANIMYSISYYLKRIDSRWNVFLSINDFDNFNISQETNPVLNLGFTHKLNSQLRLFVESHYKSAGALNMCVNYFELFIRTGIVWNIK